MHTILRWVLAVWVCGACAAAEDAAPRDLKARQEAYLKSYAARRLPQGPNPHTWVDSERWCVAHACLARGVRLDEANQYLSSVQWASLWHGLVADTDIQVTDLLRTYMEFRDSPRLSKEARAHLKAMFEAWRVPNPDRNRDADAHYEWPCEYTENHSLNILVAAYLIDDVLGRDRSPRLGLLRRFLWDRARWGWSEFHSPSYADATAKALTCLVDFAPDRSLARLAEMHLDLLAFEFASQCLHTWRGVPYARGYGAQVNNRRNSFVELARLWFGDADPKARYGGGTFLAHLLTSRYRPPEGAVRLARDAAARGRYVMHEVCTHGPSKLRVPITILVGPNVTMASAQGFGSYYDGCYWSISFGSSPDRVITGRYGRGRNILQRGNVMVTFGEANWYGPFDKRRDGAATVATDGKAFVGQVALAPDCHLLMVGDTEEYRDLDAFAAALRKLAARFEDGTVTWTMPGGATVRMFNRRVGEAWQMTEAQVDGKSVRLDGNMLFDSPHLRSERGSGIVDVRVGARGWHYDFRDLDHPMVRQVDNQPMPQSPPERIAGPLDMEFVYVPGGEFPLGSPAAEGRENERPQHWTRLDAFYISRTEVTVDQYEQYLRANPKLAATPGWLVKDWCKTDRYARSWVTWEEATAFCKWLSGQGRGTFRLPTEAEWEKAAKGYAHRRYPWGDHYDGTQAGTKNGTYAEVGTHPIDRGPFGAMDMAGNVWEWCADWYTADAYRGGAYANPRGPATGKWRVLRGCGWNFDPDTFRCSYRSGMAPDQRGLQVGFRVVREAGR